MAYIQKPGRGNHSKTGHGLPSAFRQEKEDKVDVITKESQKIHDELNVNPKAKAEQLGGVNFDPEAGFKRNESNIKNVINGDYINRVQGDKTIATVNKNSREAKKFTEETNKLIADQNFRRDKMSNYLNKRKATPVTN